MSFEVNLAPKYKRQLTMFREEARLASFKNWVFSDDQICNAAKMAEAGFYYVGTKAEPDSVQCFLCCKMLEGWDTSDDPWKEHRSHSKDCAFAALKTPEESLTAAQLFDLRREQIKCVIKKLYQELIQHIEEQHNEIHNYVQNL